MNDNPYRLPRTAIPSRYRIELRPDLDAATFSGKETVAVDVVEPTEELVLNAIEVEIDEATLDGRPLDVTYEPSTERVFLTDGDPIAPGTHELHIWFRGVLNDKLHGFYRSTYTDPDGTVHTIATTQFEATDARRAFPCWDEPDLKAVFEVTLVVPESLMAVSNMAEVERRNLDNGTVAIDFAPSPKMSTYLVAFIVGPFVATDPIDAGGVPLRVIHRPGREHLTAFAAQEGAHYLQWFADYYDIPYIGDKMDLIAIPDFAFGAMENLGAVTFRESALLVDSTTAGQTERERVAAVIAHELAHMWFGDFVTMKWWNGVWLNEAFATFMEMLAVDDHHPDWKTWLEFSPARSVSMVTDALAATRPVEFEVVAPAEADQMFDVLTYQKGSSLVRMLQQYLGEETFREGVRRYLVQHGFGNTETADLWAALEEVSGEPVGDMMASWIFRGGFPEVAMSVTDHTMTLRQRRFRYLDGQDGEPWGIPFAFRDAERGRRLVFDTPTATVDEVTAPVVGNAGGHGFYRVRYDDDLLDGLSAGLGDLLPLERYGLIDDLWASVVAGTTDVGRFLEVVAGYRGETEHAVWQAVTGSLGELSRVVRTDDAARVSSLIVDVVGPKAAELGWEPRSDESDLTRKLRGLLLRVMGTVGGDEATRTAAADTVATILAGDTPVDPEVAVAAIRTAADAGLADYDAYVDRFQHAADPQEENRFLYSLPLFPREDLVDRTFSMVLDGTIRTQNGPFVVSLLLANRHAGRHAWEVFKKHWDEQVEMYPPMLIRRSFEHVWTLNAIADDVHHFFEHREVPEAEKALAQALERMDAMAALRERLAKGW